MTSSLPVRRIHRIAAIVAVSALGGVVAACGGSESGAPDAPPESESAAAQPADAAVLVVQTQDREFSTIVGIWARYDDTRGTPLEIGPPTADAVDEPGGGKSMPFERGTVYWSPTTGAKVVRGALLQTYLDEGGPGGGLGYPVGDETVEGARVFSEFEGWVIALEAGEMSVVIEQ